MIKKIIIPYFPKELQYLSPLVFISAGYLAFRGFIVWSVVLVMVGVIVLTTRYVTEIDLNRKRFRDFLFFLWIHFDEEVKHFNTIDRIVITKENIRQKINTRIQSRQLNWSEYTATLICDNSSLDLITRPEKHELVLGLKEFADFLNVQVEDRTTPQPYIIDLSKVSQEA